MSLVKPIFGDCYMQTVSTTLYVYIVTCLAGMIH